MPFPSLAIIKTDLNILIDQLAKLKPYPRNICKAVILNTGSVLL